MLLLPFLPFVWAPALAHLLEDGRCNQTEWQKVPGGGGGGGASDEKGYLLNVSINNWGQSNALFLTWEYILEGTQGFSLVLYDLGTNTLLQNGSATPSATSFNFQGLLPGTQYIVEITALLTCPWNSTRRIIGQTVPLPVRNVTLSHDTSSDLLASWSEPPGGRDGYQLVLYHIDSQAPVKNSTFPKGTTTFHFERLLPGSEYALRITTLAGHYKASTSARGWTAPTAPKSITFQSPSPSSSLVASWTNSEGAEWLYFTLQNLHSPEDIRTVSIKRGLTNYTFQHLQPGAPYHLDVKAVAGPHLVKGPNVTAYTYPLKPINVSLINYGRSNTLKAAWSSPAGEREYYLVILQKEGSSIPARNVSVGRNNTYVTFHNLDPGRHYTAWVSAVAGLLKATAKSISAWTYPTAPSAGRLLNQGSAYRLQAHWQEAAGTGYVTALYSMEPHILVQNSSLPMDSSAQLYEGLRPGTQYALEVYTVAGPHISLPLHLSNWTHPLPPDHLNLSNDGHRTRSLRASWQNPFKGRGLYIGVLLETKSQLMVKNVTLAKTNITFEMLIPGCQYTLKMASMAGPFQSRVQIVSDWTYPLVPSGVMLVSSRWSLSLMASWHGAPGDRDHFFLRFYSLEQSLQRNITIGPSLLNFTFEDLQPGSQYFLEVTAVAGPYRASSQTVSAWTYPLSLANVSVKSSQNPQQLIVSWMESGKGQEYLVQVYSEDFLSVIQNMSVPQGTTQVTLEKLVPGTRYHVEIVSRAGPHYISSQRVTGYTVPLSPQSLKVTSHSSSMLTVQWNAPAGQRDGYMVSLSEEGSTDTRSHMFVEKASTNITIVGLTPGTCYNTAVWSVAGPYSSASRNSSACTAPLPATSVQMWNDGHPDRLLMAWEPPASGRLDGYKLNLYHTGSGTSAAEASLGSDATNFTFSGLTPGINYLSEIFTKAGPYQTSAGNISAWTSPLPPRMVLLSNKGLTDKLSASWEPPTGDRSGYVLTLYYAALGTVVSIAHVEKDITNYTFGSLIPGSKYLLEVASLAGPFRVSTRNVSDWTYPLVPKKLSVKTKEGNPVLFVTWAKPLSKPEHCQLQLWHSENSTLLQYHTLTQWQVRHDFQGLVPGRNYSISLTCMAGPYKKSSEMTVVAIEPMQVKELQCQPDATSMFLNWTMTKSDIKSYVLTVKKFPEGVIQQSLLPLIVSRTDFTLVDLTTNTSYQIQVNAVGRNGIKGRAATVVCSTSVEVFPPPVRVDIPQFDANSRVIILPDMFSEENGLIEYYGIVVTTNESLLRPTQEIISRTWFDHYYGQEDSYLAVLVPNPFHPNGSTSPKAWPVTMGSEECSHSQATCNGKLKTNVQYRFSIAAFTKYSQQTPKVSFTAFSAADASADSATLSAPIVAGIIMGFLVTATAIAGWVYLKHLRTRRVEKSNMSQEMSIYSLRNTHRPIPLQSFKQYYETRTANSNQGFFQDFEELKEVGKEQPKIEAERPANSTKNRYPHVLPYDYSRVKLNLLEGQPHSDYINASFVPGYSSPKEFIATQGPLKKTVDDFWRLVWEKTICTIVMLTVGMENGRVLCEYYWPTDTSPVTSGEMRIHLLAQNFADEWTTREFKLQHEGLNTERRVSHLHYTAWPNHGVPESTQSMIAFIELVRAHMQNVSECGPILVHGSAGLGRTGTFIALDRLLQQLKHEKLVDIFNTIYSLRMNRHRMIETLGQYIFLHNCILGKISEDPLIGLSEISHPVALKTFVRHHTKNSSQANAGFLREYEMLLEVAKEEINSSIPPSLNQPSNLSSSKIPYDRSKVKFLPLDRNPFSDLAHVWFIPGCNSAKDYIAVEGPDKLALEEFWGLIWEHSVHTIITLQPGQINNPAPDKSCWPSEGHPVCTETLTIQQGPAKMVSGWPCSQLRLKYEKKAKERLLQRFQFSLGEGEELPDPEILVNFLTIVRQLVPFRKRTSPFVLHCSSGGVGQMGMLIALDTLLQQLKGEKSVDVYGVVLRLVRSCCLMTPSLDKYIYLYECIRDVITQRPV